MIQKPKMMMKANPDRRSLESADTVLWLACISGARRFPHPIRRAEIYLSYLETYPTGSHNRAAAERVEDLIDELASERTKRDLHLRLRAIRDPYMPPIEADTWSAPSLSAVSF